MIATIHSCNRPSAEQRHADFLSLLPRIETHARIAFRYLACPGKRDDAVAETIALAWKWFLRLDERGKDVNEFVTVFAAYASRAVRCGRRLCGQEKAKDVCSSLAQRRHCFRVEALDCCTHQNFGTFYSAPQGQDHQDTYEERLADNTITPPPDQAAFRIDFPAWLSRLRSRDREIVQDMTLEHTTLELADRHEVSPGRISQLRREFHADYRRFHGEATCA